MREYAFENICDCVLLLIRLSFPPRLRLSPALPGSPRLSLPSNSNNNDEYNNSNNNLLLFLSLICYICSVFVFLLPHCTALHSHCIYSLRFSAVLFLFHFLCCLVSFSCSHVLLLCARFVWGKKNLRFYTYFHDNWCVHYLLCMHRRCGRTSMSVNTCYSLFDIYLYVNKHWHRKSFVYFLFAAVDKINKETCIMALLMLPPSLPLSLHKLSICNHQGSNLIYCSFRYDFWNQIHCKRK